VPINGLLILECIQCGRSQEVQVDCVADLDIVDLANSVGWKVDEDDELYCDDHEITIIQE